MPSSLTMVSTTMSVNHITPKAYRNPARMLGIAPGNTICRKRSPTNVTVYPTHLDQTRVDGANAMHAINVEQEEDAEHDEELLGLFPDAEPQMMSGMSARCGTLRNIWTEESNSRLAK